MSGDVQPRKRKEKKKKKEDGTEETQQLHHYQHPPQTISDDINIHVEKEASTGGGICAKIVFFFLLTALAVLIGLIITEHRELTDLDAIDTDSRFSKLFAGWTDNSPHNDDDDHLLDEADLQENNDFGEEAESEEDVTSQASEEENDEEEEEENNEETEEVQEEEEESAQDYEESENVSQAEEDDEEIERDEEESEETYEESREASEEEEEEDDDEVQQEEDADSNEDSQPNIAESDYDDGNDKDVDDDDDNDDDEDDDYNDGDGDKEESEENNDEVAGSEEEIREERDVSEENVAADEGFEDAQPQSSGTGSVAVKVGVGVSIVVVAYVVLVRKWKSDSGNSANVADSPLPTPDLSRRNTIVPPPSLEEVEPDMENVEEEYSEEDVDQDSDENTEQRPSPAKQKYRELQTTYSRSFTPDADIEHKSKPNEDFYRDDDDEEYEEDEEISENDDDEELLKKLEAKYGKLRRDSNYEDEEEEEEDEDDEEGEVDDDDFFASWKRVNAPRTDESESEKEEEKHSGAQAVYDYANITNTEDYAIKDEIDEAQREIHNNTAYALKLFDAILHNNPSSPRALYGRAQTLDALAEIKRSNEILQQAISAYIQTINAPNVPDALFQTAAERCIQRMHFIGRYGQAVSVHKMLINRFPDVAKFRNQLAITYLSINNIENARRFLQETLVKWPNDGVALVHYGFILKTADNKLKEAAYYMRKGIRTRDEGVIDGRFYFHLGDALERLGRKQQAMDIYEEGVKEKVFLSKYQRSLYNVARLTGQPWWQKKETPYSGFYKTLEAHWKEIRDEGLAVLNEKGYFKDESENLKDVGDWKQFELYARGIRNKENCKKCPVTCQIIANLPDAGGCKRGQSKFSVIHPRTHVWPHCGPTNCRLRVHLGLKVPPKTYLRVAEETRSWKEGRVFIFDDSFEHEVWHNGTDFRLVLIVDVWHPELTAMEKKTLTPI